MRFKGKVVLVTGGASGIGRATCLLFASEGASVGIIDINQAGSLEQEIKDRGGKAIFVTGSISSVSDVEAIVSLTQSTFGRLDYLFNNAGVELISPLLETTEEDWDKVLETNLKGTFLMSKQVIKHMIKQGSGVIVNNASDAGMRGTKLNAAYSTSKAGVIHLTKSMALDYAKYGIRTNCICPGCIATPLCKRFNAEIGARHGKAGEEVLSEFVQASIPMLRVGTPEEVAQVVLFLCSSAAQYINGAIIPVDGGLTCAI